MENEWRNKKRTRKGEETLPPLYTAEDAIKSLELFKPVKYDEIVELTPNINVRFNDARTYVRFCNYRNMGKRRWRN